jgi:hypothetical protein
MGTLEKWRMYRSRFLGREVRSVYPSQYNGEVGSIWENKWVSIPKSTSHLEVVPIVAMLLITAKRMKTYGQKRIDLQYVETKDSNIN